MSGFKPLIFVQPYSDSVLKLKEIIEETAEEDGIEIFEVDDPNEVGQMLPTIGQSLTIFSNPKKCASILQPNRRVIQKLNSKVILLSAKSIPRKTLDKFSKIGLTECIVEPVPPKTLLYKVRLLIRSLVVSGEEDQNNDEKKFSSTDDTDTKDTNEKQRLEKGISSDDNVIDYNLKGKLGNDLEILAEDDDAEAKSGYKEDAINKEWQGKVNNTSLAFDDNEDDEKKNKEIDENESYIDSYLRGKKSSISDIEFEEEESEKKNKQIAEIDDLYDTKSKSTSLNFEEESSNSKKSNKEKDDAEDDKFYKGKINNTTLEIEAEEDEDDISKDQSEDVLDLKNNKSKDKLLNLEQDDEENNKKKDQQELEEQEDNKNKNEDGFTLEADEVSKGKTKEELILENEQESKKREDLDFEENDEKRRKNNQEVLSLEGGKEDREIDAENDEDIDGYMRGKVSKSLEITEEEEIDARNANALSALADDDEDSNKKEDSDFDLEGDEEQNQSKIDLIDDENENNKKDTNDLDLEADDYAKNEKKSDLDLEFEDDLYDREKTSSQASDKDNSREKDGPGLNLEFESEFDEEGKKREENELKDYNRRKSSAELDLEAGDEDRKHSGHTEHISTNMDSRKGVKHQEYDWDINNKKDKSESYGDDKKKKSEIEISFRQKVDLGEQTIDYRKLKSEFEAITINRQATGKKTEGPKYYSEDSDKEFLKGIYTDEFGNVLEDIKAIAKLKKEEDEREEIFHPKSNGIEIAIRVLNLYANKKLIKEDIFSFITTNLLRKFGAHSFFFIFDPAKKDFSLNFAIKSTSEFANEELINSFAKMQDEKSSEWNEMKLPTWNNEKFNTEENLFFFPYYEGANKLGYTICLFNNKFDGKSAKAVEVILETARGIYLEEFHRSGNSEKYNTQIDNKKNKSKEDNEDNEESKGFIKSIFGKFFGKAS